MSAATTAPSWRQDAPPGEPGRTKVQARRDQLHAALLTDDGLRQLAPAPPLIDGWLYRDSVAWLHGKPGHGKTFVAVDIAGCVANGIAWHGHTTTVGKVLYLIAEGARGVGKRVEAWKLAHGVTSSNITFLPVAVQLLTDTDLEAFAALIAEHQPALVVIDTQARVTVGAEENSARDMGLFVDSLERLRSITGACILVVHHESRSGESLRGSTALEGAATSIMRCSKDGSQLTLDNPKQKDAPEQPTKVLALAPLGDSAVVSHEPVRLLSLTTESQHALLETLRDQFGTDGASTTRLLEACSLSKPTFYRALASLKEQGLVTQHTHRGRKLLMAASLDEYRQVSLVSPGLTEPDGNRSQVSHPFRGETSETHRDQDHRDAAATQDQPS